MILMEHKGTRIQSFSALRTGFYVLVSLCAFVLLQAIVGCSLNDDEEPTERIKVGDRVPSFALTVDDGEHARTFSTARLTGETVIVFFNTTCGDCQRELPRLNDYYLQHRSDEGFQMVAISREEGAESVAAYWDANHLQIPYFAQTDRRIYNLFATSIIPRVYFCTAEGVVTRIFVEKIDADF